jgi:hypothetical protein
MDTPMLVCLIVCNGVLMVASKQKLPRWSELGWEVRGRVIILLFLPCIRVHIPADAKECDVKNCFVRGRREALLVSCEALWVAWSAGVSFPCAFLAWNVCIPNFASICTEVDMMVALFWFLSADAFPHVRQHNTTWLFRIPVSFAIDFVCSLSSVRFF